MRSLIQEVADSVMAPGVKRGLLFWAPYVPFQQYLGCYQEAFEVGAVLGYAFRNRLSTFAELFSEPGRGGELATLLQELARRRLAEVGEPKDFFDLAIFAEEARIKANWRQSGCKEAQIKFLEKHNKMPLEQASGNLHVAVSIGIGLGSAFPELTEQLWKVEHERPIGRDEWTKWPKTGYGDEPEGPVTLAKRQGQVLLLVQLFVSKARPELLPQFKVQS